MRFVKLIPVVAALLISTASGAYAQAWDAYVNRENFFTVNLPNEPTQTQVPYKTVKGTDLTARVFTSIEPPGTLLAGTYRVTVVDYTNAKGEEGDAMEQARQAIKARGTAKYDEVGNIDQHRSWRLAVETPTARILSEIVLAANNRLYIVEAEVPLNVPPPAQFQASLQILDENGVRIRTRTAPAAPAKEATPVGQEANTLESNKVAAAITGSWRNPNGGTCEAAYFKSGTRTKTGRGEEALSGTVVNMGVTVNGQLILSGAREGQFINPMNDKAIFLFENKPGDKLDMFPIDAPARGWPEVVLELCPGSRG